MQTNSPHVSDAFLLLRDPIEMRLTEAALEAAWAVLKPGIAQDRRDTERERLAYIVASCAMMTKDRGKLIRLSLARFKRRPRPRANWL
jgi:hypothetical protein